MKLPSSKIYTLILLACIWGAQSSYAQAVNILGDKVIWHTITLELEGPDTNETATPNPFTDRRMDVTFTHPVSGTEYVVPGFFAADGDAANTSATSGDKWHCYLRPNKSGTWNYSVSFRQGTDVASSTAAIPGTALSPYDGVSGSFVVSATNPATLPDFRARGRLNYVGKHHLQFEGDGSYFLKFGPDSPENMLEYVDFDNTPSDGYPIDIDGKGTERAPAGYLKSWDPHQSDYNNDGETWQNGKGTELLGAINYIASTGANSVSTLLYNLWGDGRRTFPYTDTTNRERFDCSKLDQWEIVFNHAEQKGLHLHFKLFENENGKIHDGGGNTLGPERRLYYREMIARFGHHLALNWNISEEINMGGEAVIEGSLKYFEDNDPWQSNRVFHTAPSATAKLNRYTQYLGKSEMTGVSMQIELSATSQNVFDETKYWVDESAAAGRPWVCANDEQGPGNLGIRASEDGTRKYTLWGNIMAGGAGVEYYVGGKDLSMEDYRTELDAVLVDADIAINDFFHAQNIPFWVMSNNDSLIDNTAAHCLAADSDIFVIYLEDGGTTNLDLSGMPGTYEVQWFDPRNGGAMQNGSVTSIEGGSSQPLGTAPNSTTEDWVILVKKNDVVSIGERWVETGGRVVMEVENTATPYGTWTHRPTDTTGYPTGATGTGHLEYMGAWSGSEPHANSTSLIYQFKINQGGKYHLNFRAHKRLNEGDGSDKHNDCFVKMIGDFDTGSDHIDIAALTGHSKIYGGNDNSWGRAKSLDNGELADHTPAIYEFKAGETYTFIVSGRSNQFNIDRILFYHESLSQPNDNQFKGYPESPRDSGPVVSAGVDKVVLLPKSDVALFGSAADDGTIVSYSWSQESGPSDALLSGSATPYLTASSLEAGSYVFRLTATDDEGNASSNDVTVEVIAEVIDPNKVVIEFEAPFIDGELNGQHNWNAESDWIVNTATDGSVSSNTPSNIAVLDQPVILALGETVTFTIDFEFAGTYATPSSHAYAMLAGLKATNTADHLGTGSDEPDANIQLLPTDGNYRLLDNFSGISGASNLTNAPDGGDQLRLTYELTLGSDAANTAYTVRLENLSDSTDTGVGTVTGISTAVFDALSNDGAYMFFQRISPQANGSGLSDLIVHTFCYSMPTPIVHTDIEFTAPFSDGDLNGQRKWQTSSTWTVDTANSGHATSTTNNNIAVLNAPITMESGDSFAYTVDFEFTGTTFAAPTGFAYTFLTGLKADNTATAVGTGDQEPDANVQLISGGSDYRLLNNYAGLSGASSLTGAPNPGDQLRLHYEITLGNSATTSSYTVRLENLTDGTDSGVGTVDGYTTASVDYIGIYPEVYDALTGGGAYLFIQQINPSNKSSGLTGVKVDTVALQLTVELSGFDKFVADHALIEGMFGDDDGDQVNNLLEYACGGDPNDADNTGSPFGITGVTDDTPAMIHLEFRRRNDDQHGLTYQLESTHDLAVDWVDYNPLVTVEPDIEDFERITVSIPASGDALFVRLRVDAP